MRFVLQLRHASSEGRRMLLRPQLHLWSRLRVPRKLRLLEREREEGESVSVARAGASSASSAPEAQAPASQAPASQAPASQAPASRAPASRALPLPLPLPLPRELLRMLAEERPAFLAFVRKRVRSDA